MKPFYHDTTPPNTGVFSEQEISRANIRHDLAYGWSPHCPWIYSNPFRLHESIVGKPFDEAVEAQIEKRLE